MAVGSVIAAGSLHLQTSGSKRQQQRCIWPASAKPRSVRLNAQIAPYRRDTGRARHFSLQLARRSRLEVLARNSHRSWSLSKVVTHVNTWSCFSYNSGCAWGRASWHGIVCRLVGRAFGEEGVRPASARPLLLPELVVPKGRVPAPQERRLPKRERGNSPSAPYPAPSSRWQPDVRREVADVRQYRLAAREAALHRSGI